MEPGGEAGPEDGKGECTAVATGTAGGTAAAAVTASLTGGGSSGGCIEAGGGGPTGEAARTPLPIWAIKVANVACDYYVREKIVACNYYA